MVDADQEVAMIEARGLSKRYGATLAVDDLSFEIKPGRVTGFLGPNGAGKTTTMRLILGLDHPTKGTVSVNGRPYADRRFPLHEVGALLDASAVHPGRRAEQHLWALAQSNRIPRTRVKEVLELVGLSGVARKRIGTFSLGMNQRLGIAATMLGDPGVLMFDEPVNGLDPEGIVWIRNLFKRLASEGRTVFVSSHLMSEMALTAENLIVIGRGHLIAEGTIDELTSRTAGSVVVKSPQMEQLTRLLTDQHARIEADGSGVRVRGLDAPAIGELAAAHSIVLHELAPEQASLEETFFELTGESVEYRADEPVPNMGA
jgi:ABC-2 type transport system ATP-binding protein